MEKKKNNYAFIDTQNTWKGVSSSGWVLDWIKFRIYLQDKYNVEKAYLFIGYMDNQVELYMRLEASGYIIVFKPTLRDRYGKVKGNCDADMVLEVMIHKDHYNKAILVTSDGDFYSLIRYLYDSQKLEVVISPYNNTCSQLVKDEAKERLVHIETIRYKVYRDINEKAPRGDETPQSTFT